MHELGVVMEAVRTVEEFAKSNGVSRIASVVLQIGELSSMIPHYVEACYPAACDGTLLEGSALRIEVLPANGRCLSCSRIYNVPLNGGTCPFCGKSGREMLGGKEFLVKEIEAL